VAPVAPREGRLASPVAMRYNPAVVPLSCKDRTFAGYNALLPVLLAFGLVTGACGRKIGDACTTSADCDPSSGARTCDLSQPGGYCVIEGCDARSCPTDSFCLRFFPAAFATSLDGTCPDVGMADGAGPADGGAGGISPAAGCQPDEQCIGLASNAHVCVRRSLESRICVQSCGDNGDCRAGYVCRPTGQDGNLPLTLNPDVKAKFCSPAP
jgi:hypothetical protein